MPLDFLTKVLRWKLRRVIKKSAAREAKCAKLDAEASLVFDSMIELAAKVRKDAKETREEAERILANLDTNNNGGQ